ncbi:MAG: glycogen synthase [Mycobacteriaceae bacterium]
MRVGVLTKEYPPDVYGGAGVHVTELVRQLRALCEVDVHCIGAPRDGACAHSPAPELVEANPALATLSADLSMVHGVAGVDLVHSHTWYTGMAGHLASLLHGVPHVLTAHSLEPRRPWKAEQLGGGYRVSSWVERTAVQHADAVIAVSEGMRRDVLDCYPSLDPARVHVVRNGIDTVNYHPGIGSAVLERLGVDPTRPVVVFVGRITRQKGVGHLIAAAHLLHPDAQLVLCAGAPDTPELAAETEQAVAELSAARSGVFWVHEMLPAEEIRELLAAAAVFVCPSVYEPLGIVNLEAMACGTAVVASDVGGIPEVVNHGRTGLLVHYDEQEPAAFRAGLAAAINELVADPVRADTMGRAGRDRAVAEFSWATVAEQTMTVYNSVLH